MGRLRLRSAAYALGPMLVVIVATVAAAAALPPGGTFIDDDGLSHEGNIEAIAAEGVTKGCNPPKNDRFCPNGLVSRGQMAAFLARALPELPRTDRDFFVDDGHSQFENQINRLAAARIVRGCNPPENNRFCPEDQVNRGQMAAFLVRSFGYSKGDGRNLFVDDNGSVFERDIDRLATAGVTKGCNPPRNDRFCPGASVTRGQMASFMARALGLPPLFPPPRKCDLAYPTVCIKPPPPDLDCGDITHRNFKVLRPDPHRFDGDGDGIGCEESTPPSTTSPPKCDPAYPTVCIKSPPPDLDCGEIPHRNFRVLPPDPHRFDGDRDGIGCET